MENQSRIELEKLLSSDPHHNYSDEELDAIEEIDAALALRIARVQFLSQQQKNDIVEDVEIDEQKIISAVAEVKKILAMDGGDIDFVAVEGKTVRVQMKGACVGCPNAVLDLKNVVERMIKDRVPGVAAVENVF